jgi:hypothetical protein
LLALASVSPSSASDILITSATTTTSGVSTSLAQPNYPAPTTSSVVNIVGALPSVVPNINRIQTAGQYSQPTFKCYCKRLTLKDGVCQNDITFFGKLVSVETHLDNTNELTLGDVRTFPRRSLQHIQPIRIIYQCPHCKKLKKNRYYIISALLDMSNKVFYIHPNSVIQKTSQKTKSFENIWKKITKAMENCTDDNPVDSLMGN